MDRISTLPQDIIEKILTLMPIQDALKTSILSRKWRYCWTTMPRLEFRVITLPFEIELDEIKKHKLIKDILYVLLLHKGPILEFSMCISDIEIADDIDPIIIHLSKNNNIKEFYFEKQFTEFYKLPYSFFSLQGLEHLELLGCVIEPPLNFNGFSMLRSLVFRECDITSKMLQRLLTNCPLLEELTLESSCNELFDVEENKCTYVELFKCLLSVQSLGFFNLDIQKFAKGGMPQKLPTPLVHLRIIDFDVSLEHGDLSFVLNVINNSPNLEEIILKFYMGHWDCLQEVNNMLDFEDYSDINLDKLEQLEIRNFRNLASEIGFVKLIMAK